MVLTRNHLDTIQMLADCSGVGWATLHPSIPFSQMNHLGCTFKIGGLVQLPDFDQTPIERSAPKFETLYNSYDIIPGYSVTLTPLSPPPPPSDICKIFDNHLDPEKIGGSILISLPQRYFSERAHLSYFAVILTSPESSWCGWSDPKTVKLYIRMDISCVRT